MVGAPVLHSIDGMPAVVTQTARVSFTHPNFTTTFEAVGAEPVHPNYEYLAFAFKSATSDALKVALKPSGLGLSLYNDNKDRTSNPPEQQSYVAPPVQPAPAPAPAPPPYTPPAPQPQPQPQAAPAQQGTSGVLLAWGREHADKDVTVVPGNYLQWAAGEPTVHPDGRIEFITEGGCKGRDALGRMRTEVARRIRAGTWNPEEGRKPFNGNGRTDRSGGGRSGSALPTTF